MPDISRLGAKTPTPVAVSNPHLATFGSKKEALARFSGKGTDGQDDVLLKDRANDNYYVLSGDRIDFSGLGVGNRVKLDSAEAEVVALEQEQPMRLPLTRTVKTGWFSSEEKPVRMTDPQIRALTNKPELKGMPQRMINDRRDNLVIQDDNSKNLYLVSAQSIDFTSVGVGDKVSFGKTTGKVTRIDDERARR